MKFKLISALVLAAMASPASASQYLETFAAVDNNTNGTVGYLTLYSDFAFFSAGRGSYYLGGGNAYPQRGFGFVETEVNDGKLVDFTAYENICESTNECHFATTFYLQGNSFSGAGEINLEDDSGGFDVHLVPTVTEPANVAFLLADVGLVGFAARRRN